MRGRLHGLLSNMTVMVTNWASCVAHKPHQARLTHLFHSSLREAPINLWSKRHGSSDESQLHHTHTHLCVSVGCISLMQHVHLLMIMHAITFKPLFIHFTPRFHSAPSLINYNPMNVAFQCSFSCFFFSSCESRPGEWREQ